MINRRDFLKAGVASAAAATWPKWALAGTKRAKARPNILFILTDQQHGRMMSCAGDKWLRTPAMDYLAANGVRFEHAYCTNPVCLPSRTSMATGMMPGRLGVYRNSDETALPSEVEGNSLGELMKRSGYDTFYGGKVHMDRALGPENGAYDESCANERERLPAQCLKFMTKKRDRPFFAVASFVNPHDICFAHRARVEARGRAHDLYRQASELPDDELGPLPRNFAITEGEPKILAERLSTKAVTPPGIMRREYSERDWRIYRWIYRRLTEKVDGEINVMFEGLKAAGLEQNTLIVFSSDHGDMDAGHRLASKNRFYEESVGVPFLMMHKGGIPAGKVDAGHLVSTGLDILPTLCDYAGINAPPYLLGRSLRPLAERRPVQHWRTYVASESAGGRMIRSSRHKYCCYGTAKDTEMLFDLQADRGEMRNLASDSAHRETLLQHREFLKQWCELSKDTQASKYTRAG